MRQLPALFDNPEVLHNNNYKNYQRVFTLQKKLGPDPSKMWYEPITFVKNYWSFRRAIGAYSPAETPIFLYKSYGSVLLFRQVRTQIFLLCKVVEETYILILGV